MGIDDFFTCIKAYIEKPLLTRAVLLLVAHSAGDQMDAERLAFSMLCGGRSAGEFSPDAFEAALKVAGKPIPDDIDFVFENVDSNRNGHLDCLEFLATTVPQRLLENDKITKSVFKMLDLND